MKRQVLVLLLVTATGGTAAAQSRKSADYVHDFHTLDRQTPMTTFGIGLGYESWEDANILGGLSTVATLDVSGQYVADAGFGAYLDIPLTYVSSADAGTPPIVVKGDNEMAVGNIELGGLYARRLNKTVDAVVHVGVALPTADDSGLGAGQPVGAFTRYSDLVDRWPSTTWLRLAISPMGRASRFFWRADLGVDLMIAHDDNYADISPVVRVDVGAGVDLGAADVTAELATDITSPPDNSNVDSTQSTLALGARYKGSDAKAQPGIAIVLPVGVDSPYLDYQDFNFAIVASITARMP